MSALYVLSYGLATSKFLARGWFSCCSAKSSTGIKGVSDITKVHLQSMFNPLLAAEHMHTHAKPAGTLSAVKRLCVYLRYFYGYF